MTAVSAKMCWLPGSRLARNHPDRTLRVSTKGQILIARSRFAHQLQRAANRRGPMTKAITGFPDLGFGVLFIISTLNVGLTGALIGTLLARG